MRFRASLARARGLGSAKAGTHHFWMQRVTSVALVPLSLWFVACVVVMTGAEHAAVSAWVRSPLTTVLLLCLLFAVFYHAQLGLQVVVEDYVHTEWLKLASLVVLNAAMILLGGISMLAVLRIALGG